MPTYAAEDKEAISKRVKELELNRTRRCFTKHGLPSNDCWCYRAGPGGNSLPCSEASPEASPEP